MRFVLLLVVVTTIGCKKTATTPAAPETPVDTKGWTKIDPDGDCQFTFAPTAITMSVPGKDKDLSIERNRMNAPRVVKQVSGDFTATVRVRGDFRTSPLTTTPDRPAFMGAGVLLMIDDRTYVRLERASLVRDGRESHYVNWELRINGQWAKAGNTAQAPLADGDTWLRLTRQGNNLFGQYSQDGMEWKTLEAFQMDMPAQVQVGLAAVTTGITTFRPDFDQFASEAAAK